MSALSRQRRAIEGKAAAVHADMARLSDATARATTRLKHDLAKPTTLAALFGVGLLIGFLRGRGRDAEAASSRRRKQRRDGETGNFTRIATVLLSAARLIELARKADDYSLETLWSRFLRPTDGAGRGAEADDDPADPATGSARDDRSP